MYVDINIIIQLNFFSIKIHTIRILLTTIYLQFPDSNVFRNLVCDQQIFIFFIIITLKNC